ncbi:MAG: hypothetical protein HXX10_15770 [Rhodoplanes sp.]|uniref:hypothetical protein n=1 Tax=Rhodoplanes sp. TaxID=1968906 RepID=UPI00179D70E0|nr:hypothetical protein [Rhodoplanes sp.]NVO15488.1 hypothetical protein [Rhodoplanes sp.]
MAAILAFLPFIVFAVLDRLVGSTVALAAGAATAIVMVVHGSLLHGRSLKVLEAGTIVLFGGLALWEILGGTTWSMLEVRLRVDAGLMLVVLLSIALKKPFTLQYARESRPKAQWSDPAFVRSNYVITSVWAAAFLIMVIADLVLIYRPDVPVRWGIIATICAILLAVKFTALYPKWVRRQAEKAAAAAAGAVPAEAGSRKAG